MTMKKNNRSITIAEGTNYIFFEDKKYIIENSIIFNKEQFLIPMEYISMIMDYFNNGKIIQINEDKSILNQDEKKTAFTETNSQELNDIKEINKIIETDATSDDILFAKNKYIYEKKPESMKINAIVIDPGHGGNDPGAIGYSGEKEKDIVLRLGMILNEKLKDNFTEKKILMTRNNDMFIPLEKRSSIANYVYNKYGACLFISLHVNASRSIKSYGFETWYLVEEYRRNIIKKGEISNDHEVENLLNLMLNDEIYKESKDLANKIQINLNREIGCVSQDRGIKEQTYFVIKKSIMPAILVEIGFNTNKYEEIRLTKNDYLIKIADGILKGTKEFINDYEKNN